MKAAFVLVASSLSVADALIACAYTCDKDWPGLDTGRCLDGDACPDTMSSQVTNDICWGLPFQPAPGDILLHDQVPFQSQDSCQAYIDSWENKAALQHRLVHVYARRQLRATESDIGVVESEAGNEDKVSFEQRGQFWASVAETIGSKCFGIGGKAAASCKTWEQIGKEGYDTTELKDCAEDCAAMIGLDVLEAKICDAAADKLGPVGTWLCKKVEHSLLEPVNAWVDSHVVQPLIKTVDKVEDALAHLGHRFASLFGF